MHHFRAAHRQLLEEGNTNIDHLITNVRRDRHFERILMRIASYDAAYLKLEGVVEGYYVVFDHRQKPEPRVETETVAGVNIRSYVIPIIQVAPSNALWPAHCHRSLGYYNVSLIKGTSTCTASESRMTRILGNLFGYGRRVG